MPELANIFPDLDVRPLNLLFCAMLVQVTATDNVGVAKTELYVIWDTTSVSNGTHTLIATAQDPAGNVGTSSTVTVNVNNTPTDTEAPTIVITSPVNGAVVSRLTVTVNATDNMGVAKVELYLDGVLKATATTSPFTFSNVRMGGKRGSSHTLQAKAHDAAGNVGVSPVITVKKK